jgi:hypothetical protein
MASVPVKLLVAFSFPADDGGRARILAAGGVFGWASACDRHDVRGQGTLMSGLVAVARWEASEARGYFAQPSRGSNNSSLAEEVARHGTSTSGRPQRQAWQQFDGVALHASCCHTCERASTGCPALPRPWRQHLPAWRTWQPPSWESPESPRRRRSRNRARRTPFPKRAFPSLVARSG